MVYELYRGVSQASLYQLLIQVSNIKKRFLNDASIRLGFQFLEGEPEVRTVLFASGTILAYLQSGFSASEAPHWRIGAKLYLGFAVVAMFIFIGIHFGLKWEAKKKDKALIEEHGVTPKVQETKPRRDSI